MFNRCIWTEGLMEDMEAFVGKRGRYAGGDTDMNEAALFALSVSVGLQFYPGVGTVRKALSATMRRWNRSEVHRWRSMGKELLALDHNPSVASLEGLQALVLIGAQGMDDASYLSFIDDLLRRGVLAMELHKLGRLSLLGYEKGSTVEQCRRKEMAVRVFWLVVQRDWTLGQSTRCYAFHPDQITTRPPLNLTDDDMRAIPFPPSRPFDEWTPTTFTLTKLHLSHIIRGSIDMLNEQAHKGESGRIWTPENRAVLDQQYSAFLQQLPEFYRLDKDFRDESGRPAASVTACDIQRWLAHQIVFSLMLKLHRSDLGKKRVQSSCVSLAYIVLEIHGKIRKRCRVIDSMAMNQDHLYSACIVLLLDLYADHGAESSRATGLARESIRGKIKQAISWIDKSHPRTAKAARLLQKLLEVEEQHVEEHGEKGSIGYNRLLEVTAELNQKESELEKSGAVITTGAPLAEAGMTMEDMLADIGSASTPPASRGSTAVSTASWEMDPAEFPVPPNDTSLFPHLAWPYDGQAAALSWLSAGDKKADANLTSQPQPQPQLFSMQGGGPFPASSPAEAEAAMALASAGQAMQPGASASLLTPAPTASNSASAKMSLDMLSGLLSTNPGGTSTDGAGQPQQKAGVQPQQPYSLNSILGGTQPYNDDVLWQLMFSGTTQVGAEMNTGQIAAALQ